MVFAPAHSIGENQMSRNQLIKTKPRQAFSSFRSFCFRLPSGHGGGVWQRHHERTWSATQTLSPAAPPGPVLPYLTVHPPLLAPRRPPAGGVGSLARDLCCLSGVLSSGLLGFLLTLDFLSADTKLLSKWRGVCWSLMDFLRSVTASLVSFAISVTAVTEYSEGLPKQPGVWFLCHSAVCI